MSDICYEDIDQNCDACYEITAGNCLPIVIQAGLTPASTYWLWCIAPDGNYYKEEITIAGDGSFSIDPGSTVFPTGLFNPYAGVFEFFLSDSQLEANYQSFSYSASSYNCILVTWTVVCCDNTYVPPSDCENFIDSLTTAQQDCLTANFCDPITTQTHIIFSFDIGETSTTVTAIADMAGVYSIQTTSNVTSSSYTVNGGSVSFPITIAEGDIVSCTIVPTDNTASAFTKITAP